MDDRPPVKVDPRRRLPAVGSLAAQVRERAPDLPDWAILAAVRQTLERAREALAGARHTPEPPGEKSLADEAARRAGRLAADWPVRVVNATGVPLHTNLGRAPLAPGAARAAARAATHYCALELDLESGERGDRQEAVREKLVLLSGAEDALAVNNNAAALLLALAALARGREVVVSRGELVEIGGSFRVPEIVEQAGVRLVEVGTTNRTHADDYRRAIGSQTAALLKVHRSNFELQGFVCEVELRELARIAAEHGLPLVEDLGSGALAQTPDGTLPDESLAPQRLRLGADLVCFSADKLLGGPQAGIVLGSRQHVRSMRRHPLARALRLDKLCLGALDWTLRELLEGRGAESIPVLRQLLEPLASLEARARQLAARLAPAAGHAWRLEVETAQAPLGGGTLPGRSLPSWVVTLRGGSVSALAGALRRAPVPVIARVRDDALVLDVRTLLEGEEDDVEAAVCAALGARRVDRRGTVE